MGTTGEAGGQGGRGMGMESCTLFIKNITLFPINKIIIAFICYLFSILSLVVVFILGCLFKDKPTKHINCLYFLSYSVLHFDRGCTGWL